MIFGQEQTLQAADMQNPHLQEEVSVYHSVPEDQNGTSDEEAVLYLKYFYLLLTKKQNSAEVVGAISQCFRNFR